MKYSMQVEKMIKKPLMLAVVAAFTVGCSDTEAEFNTQDGESADIQSPAPATTDQFQSRIVEIQLADSNANPSASESHSDSDMAAKNWDNADGPDTHAVAPSNDGMVAEEWRSLEQAVSHSDSDMAAKNWNNADGPDTHAVAPSNDGMTAKNWDNADGPDMHAVQPSGDDGMAAEYWREIRQTVVYF